MDLSISAAGSSDALRSSEKPASRRGRPCARDSKDKDVPKSLLTAADSCVIQADSSRVTGRQIAESAGVSQAMINYYFESKDGLLASLFEQDYRELTLKLNNFLAQVKAGEGSATSVEELLLLLEDHFQEHSAMTVLLYSEGVHEKSIIYSTYVSRLASRGYAGVVRIVNALIETGFCRKDIAAEHAAYMICSMCTVPNILRSIFERAFNTELEGEARLARRRAVAMTLTTQPNAAA